MIAITTATIMRTPGTIAANATSIAAEATSESIMPLARATAGQRL
jgi:uncharacterized membrane protein